MHAEQTAKQVDGILSHPVALIAVYLLFNLHSKDGPLSCPVQCISVGLNMKSK